MLPQSRAFDLLKLAVGLAFIGAGIWQYRRRSGAGSAAPGDRYGSQSGVLLLVVGAIVLIVALGGLDYRPSPSEIEAAR